MCSHFNDNNTHMNMDVKASLHLTIILELQETCYSKVTCTHDDNILELPSLAFTVCDVNVCVCITD